MIFISLSHPGKRMVYDSYFLYSHFLNMHFLILYNKNKMKMNQFNLLTTNVMESHDLVTQLRNLISCDFVSKVVVFASKQNWIVIYTG
jgi:hypothetical protein